MNQLAINFDALALPRARMHDPATSHRAAAKASSFATGHAARILGALQTHGPLAPCQMFEFTGLNVVQCDRRRKEMFDAGLIKLLEREVQGCTVWEAR